jgi:hypothetical protein
VTQPPIPGSGQAALQASMQTVFVESGCSPGSMAWANRLRFVLAIARGLEAHVRIRTERQTLFPSVEPVLQPPPFAPGGGDFKIKPTAVEQPKRLIARLSVSDSRISQRNGGNSLAECSCCPQSCPHHAVDVNGTSCTLVDEKALENRPIRAGSGRPWNFLDEQLVEQRGIEPLTFALRTRRSPS